MPLDLVDTLCELVATPSVNPMGRDLTGPEVYEARMTDALEALFGRLGIRCQRQSVHPRRENLIARIDGEVSPTEGGPLLMLEAHQDTVPVDGMTIDPFTPQLRDGRVHGRGACDIKGGMTAMLAALARLAEERPAGMPTIVMACTVNEEHGYSGATELCKLWTDGESGIIPRRPDAAIVAEPTMLDVVVAHKGVVRWCCRTRGRAAHSSHPHLGHNAIFKMARVLDVLEQYQREVAPTLGEHPLCGRPSLSVGTIRGGLSVNTVPDDCRIEIDRRLLPGDDPQWARRHVIEYLAQRVDDAGEIVHEAPFIQARGLADENNDQLAGRLAAVAREVTGGIRRVGVSYGTDAAVYSAAGVPTVVFGPGSIDQAHTVDEWLAVGQLELAAEILYRFGRG